VVPGAEQWLRDLVRVELIDRSLIIAAQALFAAVPLLVVVGSYTPSGFGTTVLGQVASVMGVPPADLAPLRELTAPAQQVRAHTGIAGLLLTLFAATSFARALRRMYERVWDLPPSRGPAGLRAALVWLLVFLAYLQVLTLLIRSLLGVGVPGGLASVLQLAGGVALWLFTPWWLLRRRVPLPELVPGAVLSAVLLLLLSRASQRVMPVYVRGNIEQFGALGVVFAASTWLVAFGGVLVVSAVTGRVLATEPALRRLTSRIIPGA
jgi:membrane protein